MQMRTQAAVVLSIILAAWSVNSAPAADPAPVAPGPNWIWSTAKAKDEESIYVRKVIDITLPDGVKAPKGGWLIATADNHFTAYVNGEKVAASDNWEAPVRAEVGPKLHAGKNVIAVLAKNDAGIAALLVKLVITTPDGKATTYVSDPSWKIGASGGEGWNKDVDFIEEGWKPAHVLGKEGIAPWGMVLSGQPRAAGAGSSATPIDHLNLQPGFAAELLYSVPKGEQGSWVNMCFDNKGRIIVSNQGGLLYRVTLDKPKKGEVEIEPIEVKIKLPTEPGKPEQWSSPVGGAHGLLHAFDSLYVVICEGKALGNGLYRLRDTDGDDKYDKAELLRALPGGGEHGPHAVVLGPDGKSLYVVAGNFTNLPNAETSRAPRHWGEDQLLPRMPDANGHDPNQMAPAGWVCKTDPDGKSWEVFCMGERNTFDISFNRDGELFGYDSDMEWDIGAPWYRPTRVSNYVSGGDSGWRNGSGKFPPYYPDTVPPTVEIGPGCPTGSTFGYGAKFPAHWQNVMYINDWTFGIIYAVTLTPEGASYSGKLEKFLTGQPLPVTDVVIGPDGAMYFTIGGRGTQSGLYRVTYTGKESTAPVADPVDAAAAKARAIRHELEAFHGKETPAAIEAAWKYLGDKDRFLRNAARIALEWQPVESWQEKALAEKDTQAGLTLAVALARGGSKTIQPQLLGMLEKFDYAKLMPMQQFELVRAYGIVFARMGKPDAGVASGIAKRFDASFPAKDYDHNRELSALLVYLGSPTAIQKTLDLQAGAVKQEEAVWYAYVLRTAEGPWTLPQRIAFFDFFNRSANFPGGASFQGFLRNMKNEALAKVPAYQKPMLESVLTVKPPAPVPAGPPRANVKDYKQTDLLPAISKGLTGRNFANGKAMFTAAACVNCHRFAGEGAYVGPDLTAIAGRFSAADILDSIVEPSKVISDQYAATIFTMKDGAVVIGKIVNVNDDTYTVAPNLLVPTQTVQVVKADIKSHVLSPISPMPPGLINVLSEEEVLDLLAYLTSGGDKSAAAFK
jgi:putative heme-binding domain-containing protein